MCELGLASLVSSHTRDVPAILHPANRKERVGSIRNAAIVTMLHAKLLVLWRIPFLTEQGR